MSDTLDTRNIRLIISYDGTRYHGWQRQDRPEDSGPSGAASGTCTTVQGEIEAALEKIHKHPTALSGSGRTDSGVHAAGQAANFYTDIKNMAASRFIPALNSILPGDIRILAAEEVPRDFHARFDAKSRMYRYFFVCRREVLPAETPFVHKLRRFPDIVLLNEYARLLHGEFDCTVFAVPGDKSKSRHRYIFNCCFFMEDRKLVFEIRANAFLWKMVRSIAGTMLFYEEKKTEWREFQKIITSGKRCLAGPTLPPTGLFLWQILY
jgi:tRNA pseudouridine38-40 synthase